MVQWNSVLHSGWKIPISNLNDTQGDPFGLNTIEGSRRTKIKLLQGCDEHQVCEDTSSSVVQSWHWGNKKTGYEVIISQKC